jgi:hypothetical protein
MGSTKAAVVAPLVEAMMPDETLEERAQAVVDRAFHKAELVAEEDENHLDFTVIGERILVEEIMVALDEAIRGSLWHD